MKIRSNKLHSLCVSQEAIEALLHEEGEMALAQFEKTFLAEEETFKEVSIPHEISGEIVTDAEKGVCLLLTYN